MKKWRQHLYHRKLEEKEKEKKELNMKVGQVERVRNINVNYVKIIVGVAIIDNR